MLSNANQKGFVPLLPLLVVGVLVAGVLGGLYLTSNQTSPSARADFFDDLVGFAIDTAQETAEETGTGNQEAIAAAEEAQQAYNNCRSKGGNAENCIESSGLGGNPPDDGSKPPPAPEVNPDDFNDSDIAACDNGDDAACARIVSNSCQLSPEDCPAPPLPETYQGINCDNDPEGCREKISQDTSDCYYNVSRDACTRYEAAAKNLESGKTSEGKDLRQYTPNCNANPNATGCPGAGSRCGQIPSLTGCSSAKQACLSDPTAFDCPGGINPCANYPGLLGCTRAEQICAGNPQVAGCVSASPDAATLAVYRINPVNRPIYNGKDCGSNIEACTKDKITDRQKCDNGNGNSCDRISCDDGDRNACNRADDDTSTYIPLPGGVTVGPGEPELRSGYLGQGGW